MSKILASFILLFLIGCGSSDEGKSALNPFNTNLIDPYTDALFGYEWHLGTVIEDDFAKQRNIANNSHINIYDAWSQTRGSGVKVAVIDYNFDASHSDLRARVYAKFNVELNTTQVNTSTDNHGTGVASIIAAPLNGVGMVGVAPEASLILISANIQQETSIIKALHYAQDSGAQVICCSWERTTVSQNIKNVLQELKSDGISTIFAVGNTASGGANIDNRDSIAMLDSVIAVGATNEQNELALYSNYGANLDLVAPAGVAGWGLVAATLQNTGNSIILDQNHRFFDGTSASAPVVAGVVALMLSVNPSLTPTQVLDILTSTATKIGNATYTNGFNEKYGYGKVNASSAVAKALTY